MLSNCIEEDNNNKNKINELKGVLKKEHSSRVMQYDNIFDRSIHKLVAER